MIDDGAFAGVPIGGLGTGSIGRTYRGDAARWHLEVGRHAFEPVAADGVLGVRRAARAGRRGRRSCRRSAPTTLPAWGWTLPGRRRHVSRPVPAGVADVRARRRSASGSSASSCQPGHRRRPRVERAAGRGLRVVGREPGPDPLTVGLMFTWQDPAGRSGRRRRPAAPGTRPSTTDDVGRGRSSTPRPTHRPGLRGTFAIAASRAPASTSRPARAFDAGRRPRPVGRLRRRRAAGARADDRRPSGDGEAIGRGRGGDGRAGARASGARSGSRSPGTCPIVEFGAGRRWWKRYTRDWGRTGERAFDLAAPRPRARRPPGAPRSRPGRRPVLDSTRATRLVQGGAVQRALLPRRRRHRSGRPARSAARSPTRTMPAGSRCSSASTTRSTTRVDVDFYASFAILELFPELEARGIRDLLAAIPVDDPEIVTIEASGLPRTAQGRRHRARTTSAARTTTRSTGPTGTSSRTSTTGRTSGPSSSSRSGATRWPPGPRRRRADPRRPGRRSRPC